MSRRGLRHASGLVGGARIAMIVALGADLSLCDSRQCSVMGG